MNPKYEIVYLGIQDRPVGKNYNASNPFLYCDFRIQPKKATIQAVL